MADVYTMAIKASGITESQKARLQKKVEDSISAGNRALNRGENAEAYDKYVDAITYGAPANVIDAKLSDVIRQIKAKGTGATPHERAVLYELGVFGEEYVHGHKPEIKEHKLHVSPAPSTAVAIIAIAAAVLGTLGIAAVARPTAYIPAGDSSMVLAAFILLALLYFYVLRPKK